MSDLEKKQLSWTIFLRFYSNQNIGRATRLGVFERGNDYWLEDGLPLNGIDYETTGNSLNIEIMLGETMTHTIKNVRKVQINFSLDEINDGLDITDAEGKTTILRFEN
ncbi:MAG: DUF5335 domain-containing protein [Pyrinomonadaceae bacterium]|nr:DUF5335 domain-containing protein [Pyrinomonadaceae bacterium]